jgi:Zinc-finger double-stranded RNA-binding
VQLLLLRLRRRESLRGPGERVQPMKATERENTYCYICQRNFASEEALKNHDCQGR